MARHAMDQAGSKSMKHCFAVGRVTTFVSMTGGRECIRRRGIDSSRAGMSWQTVSGIWVAVTNIVSECLPVPRDWSISMGIASFDIVFEVLEERLRICIK